MNNQASQFLRRWGLFALGFAALVAAVNAAVDPYLIFEVPRIDRFNARKPAAFTQERLMKAYDVLRASPRTIILGSSRVDIGLNARSAAWPIGVRPVYNLGFAAGGPYVSLRYLQHALSRSRPELVLLGVDFEYFMTTREAYPPKAPEFEMRLAVTREGTVNEARHSQHVRELVHATLSLEALTDSVFTLVANLTGDSVDLVSGNWDTGAVFRSYMTRGSHPVVVAGDLLSIRDYRRKQRNDFAMRDLKAILELCAAHRIRTVVFINPMHADKLEILSLLGYWSEFEQWKRELVALTAQYGRDASGARVPLWDFSAYDAWSTEPVAKDPHILLWYWEPNHYTWALGEAVTARIFGSADAPFGALLTPEDIDAHLTRLRHQQHRYREQHPEALRRVRGVYDFIVGAPSQTMARAQ